MSATQMKSSEHRKQQQARVEHLLARRAQAIQRLQDEFRRIDAEIGALKKRRAVHARQIRIDAGLSQEAFAELVGVTPRTVQRWEAGTRKHSTLPFAANQ